MSPFPFVRFWSLGAFFFGIVLAILTIFTSCHRYYTRLVWSVRQILFRAPVKKVRDSNGVSMEAPEMSVLFALLDKNQSHRGYPWSIEPFVLRIEGRKITLPLSVSVAVTRSIPVSVSWAIPIPVTWSVITVIRVRPWNRK